MNVNRPLADRVVEICMLQPHACLNDLCGILSEPGGKTSAGFPYISSHAFQTFLARVPHLFSAGQGLLSWIDKIEPLINRSASLSDDEKRNVVGTLKVLATIANTAAVTATTDLWLLRHVLGALEKLNLIKRSSDQVYIQLPSAPIFNPQFIIATLDFLVSRRIVEAVEPNKYMPASNAARLILRSNWELPSEWQSDQVPRLVSYLKGTTSQAEADAVAVDRFLSISEQSRPHLHWMPSAAEIEIGFRLLPLILAIRVAAPTKKVLGAKLNETGLTFSASARQLLKRSGIIDRSEQVTDLGQRIFLKGPGPFGIIYAYHSYMANLSELLHKGPSGAWVERSANVAASQEANRKTFELANTNLDLFCKDYKFSYSIFIEHAVGQGEATRQRYKESGEALRYYGADLEPAAIAAAKKKQALGELPAKMKFVDHADIGKASVVLDALRSDSADPYGAVMIVGNGFHEVRNQSDISMIEIFRDYCNAGIIIVFTEESGLSNEDLTTTAWNTYHAGFRYVHELSGQGLRPALDSSDSNLMSWRKCAESGGYRVLDKYSAKTRTIFPHPRPDGKNPSISVTYFCVPATIADRLKIME